MSSVFFLSILFHVKQGFKTVDLLPSVSTFCGDSVANGICPYVDVDTFSVCRYFAQCVCTDCVSPRPWTPCVWD